MKRYDFDTYIDRIGTDCEKYEDMKSVFGTDQVIPLWIADMDFATADFIVEAMERRMKHPIFGYTFRPQCYFDAIRGWVYRHSGWDIDTSWIAFSPGVVAGVTFGMLSCTKEGDGVVIQPPVYHPFGNTIRYNHRTVLNNPLIQDPATSEYRIDFDDLDQKLAQAKAFILCNPHNPTGRVFTREELLKIGELCKKHDVTIISDEIHCDFIFQPHEHIHIASLTEDLANRTITLIAPSKSFNVAGFSTAAAIIPNPERHAAYQAEVDKIHIENGNIFGSVALKTAYEQGDEWMRQLLEYLQGNVDFVYDFMTANIPSVHCYKPEATFLMWLDFRKWGMTQEELNRFLVQEAGLGLGDGSVYGIEGTGFQRLNIGTPRSVLQRAMNQLLEAVRKHGL
ncbi:MalY/PatB family protein [Millionella massiliensis]|mgnify:CR=1 FL=1|uniref:MalY/PatB family protein n=1 Tax=Millionella massiliensis TaxID=1871023 RepID=UPI0024B80DEE|nr:PatB family C-S lyase [Millionella massiliensis]